MRLWAYLATQRVERVFMPFVALQQLAEAAAVADGPAPPLTANVHQGYDLRSRFDDGRVPSEGMPSAPRIPQ